MSGSPPLPATIAKVVRARRERLGVSQEAFADQLGFHRAFFGRIENGQNMTLLTLQRVADGFDVSVWELVREAEERGRLGDDAPKKRRRKATR